MEEVILIRILPITDQLYFGSYTYDAYLECIISNQYRIGDVAAVIAVKNYENYEWKFQMENLKLLERKDKLIFKTGGYNLAMNGALYREVGDIDEMEIQIIYQQESHNFGYIALVLSEDNADGTILKKHNNGQYSIGKDGKPTVLTIIQPGKDNIYVLKKCHNRVDVVVRRNNEDTILCSYTLEQEELSKLKFGISICLGDNCYYKWQFQNHIQWKYNLRDDSIIKLDHDYAVRKAWLYYSLNYFVTYDSESILLLMDLGVSMVDYIKTKINYNTYVKLDLDSFDIENVVKYKKKHHLHECLIYGYNDEQQKIYLIAVSKGKFKKAAISYEDLIHQVAIYKQQMEIVCMKYEPNIVKDYEFDRTLCIEHLKCFLSSETVLDTEIIYPKDDFCYGIDVYDMLLSDNGLMTLMNDVRVATIICEHTKCMVDRLKYMHALKMLDENEVTELLDVASSCYENALLIKDLVIKYSLANQERLVGKTRKCLQALKEQDIELHQNLIQVLEKKEDRM